MSSRLRVAVAVVFVFGSASTVLAASNGKATHRHQRIERMAPLALFEGRDVAVPRQWGGCATDDGQGRMSEVATGDWAVASLGAPVAGVTPYGFAGLGTNPGSGFLARRAMAERTVWGSNNCSARPLAATSSEGIREIAVDCSVGPDASGAALLDAGRRIVGIHAGCRSRNRQGLLGIRAGHYNFAISVDGPFCRALLAEGSGH